MYSPAIGEIREDAREFTTDGWFKTAISAASIQTDTCTSWAEPRTS